MVPSSTRTERDIDWAEPMLCEVFKQELQASCVYLFDKDISEILLKQEGITSSKMMDAWGAYVLAGEEGATHVRGVKALHISMSMVGGAGIGPKGSSSEAFYTWKIFSVQEPAKILASEEVRGVASGRDLQAKKDAFRAAARALVRALERRPATWQAAAGYPTKKKYGEPLPPIPVAVRMVLRLPGFQIRTDVTSSFEAGLSVEPIWRESERSFRIDLVDPFKGALGESARVTLQAFPIETVLSEKEIRQARRGEWDPGKTLIRMAHDEGLRHVELDPLAYHTALGGHRGRLVEAQVRRGDKTAESTALGWACPESGRFFRMQGIGTGYPYYYAESRKKATVDHSLASAPLPKEATAPLPVRGEAWAFFSGAYPGSTERRAPDHLLRLVEGGDHPEAIASEPIDKFGSGGYRWFDVPPPLSELQFPLRAGKTWTTPRGETATVQPGRLLQPENLTAFPIVFEKGGKVIRTLYYAPEVHAIAREEDGTGKIIRSLWLSAVRYKEPARAVEKKQGN